MPFDAVGIVVISLTAITVAIQYYACRRAGTWFFAFGLLGSGTVAVSAIALLPGTDWPQAQAVADVGILVAGCAAFASSVWLRFAFKMAGDRDGS